MIMDVRKGPFIELLCLRPQGGPLLITVTNQIGGGLNCNGYLIGGTLFSTI
jgi:hypothetical protein